MSNKNLTIANEVTMAQLCLTTTAIVENDVYEIHIFRDGSANESTFTACQGVSITVSEFTNAFYGGSKGHSAFKAISDKTAITDFYDLAKDGIYGQYNVADADCDGVDFTDEVINLWKSETCTEWSTCSELKIRREVIDAHNFKDLANCNVCCALTYIDLVAAINSANADGAGNKTATDVSSSDKIALSILLKQSYPGTPDVEIVIHYVIA
jgi:hypothetical protein